MIAALGLIGAFVLSLLVLIARGVLTDEIKGRIQQRTCAHLDATLDALPPEVRACWEDEWRAELAAKLSMPVTAWQLVCGIRHTAAELVAEAAPAAASEGHDASRHRARPITPTPLGAAITLAKRLRAFVTRLADKPAGRLGFSIFIIGVSVVIRVVGFSVFIGVVVGGVVVVGLYKVTRVRERMRMRR